MPTIHKKILITDFLPEQKVTIQAEAKGDNQ